MLNNMQTVEKMITSDQTPHSVASDLGLHCLSITRFRVSRLKRVNKFSIIVHKRGNVCCDFLFGSVNIHPFLSENGQLRKERICCGE